MSPSHPLENETSLKNVFSDDNPEKYWVDIFFEHSPQTPPGYRCAIFIM